MKATSSGLFQTFLSGLTTFPRHHIGLSQPSLEPLEDASDSSQEDSDESSATVQDLHHCGQTKLQETDSLVIEMASDIITCPDDFQIVISCQSSARCGLAEQVEVIGSFWLNSGYLSKGVQLPLEEIDYCRSLQHLSFGSRASVQKAHLKEGRPRLDSEETWGTSFIAFHCIPLQYISNFNDITLMYARMPTSLHPQGLGFSAEPRQALPLATLVKSTAEALEAFEAKTPCYEVTEEEFERLWLSGAVAPPIAGEVEDVYEIPEEDFDRLLKAGQLQLAKEDDLEVTRRTVKRPRQHPEEVLVSTLPAPVAKPMPPSTAPTPGRRYTEPMTARPHSLAESKKAFTTFPLSLERSLWSEAMLPRAVGSPARLLRGLRASISGSVVPLTETEAVTRSTAASSSKVDDAPVRRTTAGRLPRMPWEMQAMRKTSYSSGTDAGGDSERSSPVQALRTLAPLDAPFPSHEDWSQPKFSSRSRPASLSCASKERSVSSTSPTSKIVLTLLNALHSLGRLERESNTWNPGGRYIRCTFDKDNIMEECLF
eukprot:s848_g1.t2